MIVEGGNIVAKAFELNPMFIRPLLMTLAARERIPFVFDYEIWRIRARDFKEPLAHFLRARRLVIQMTDVEVHSLGEDGGGENQEHDRDRL